MDITALCLGFFWGVVFTEVCHKVKNYYLQRKK